ncbi:TPA: type 1 fimbrial protein [Providencia stuartii]|nr:type 1 fimbrial protein [Providencia stuartii]
MKRISLVLGLCIAVSTGAVSEVIKGKIALSGSILDTPCAIAMDSIDQSIDLGIIPISVLKQWGESPRLPFTIHLMGCRLHSSVGNAWQTFTITFDGPTDNNGFAVYGQASGISLVLENRAGQRIQPGVPLQEDTIVMGNRTLEYAIKMVSSSASYQLGDFETTLRFKLDYY